MIVLSIETSCDETSLAFLTNNFNYENNQELENSLKLQLETKQGIYQKEGLWKKSENNSEKVLRNNSINFVNYLNSFEILGQVISSQIDLHKDFGGVIPEIGAREHASQIHFLFQEVLKTSEQSFFEKRFQNQPNSKSENLEKFQTTKNQLKSSKSDFPKNIENKNSQNKKTQNSNYPSFLLPNLDYIMVTTTPGLASALRVGMEFAKTLKFFIDKKYQNNVELKLINHLQGHLASSFWQK